MTVSVSMAEAISVSCHDSDGDGEKCETKHCRCVLLTVDTEVISLGHQP